MSGRGKPRGQYSWNPATPWSCAAVDDLAAICAELGRHAFLLTVAPPRLHGATGVPVNPLAIF